MLIALNLHIDFNFELEKPTKILILFYFFSYLLDGYLFAGFSQIMSISLKSISYLRHINQCYKININSKILIRLMYVYAPLC